jgi:hypothetical protein
MKSILTRMLLFSFYLLFLSMVAQAAEAPPTAERENHNAAAAKQSETATASQSLTSNVLGAKFILSPPARSSWGDPVLTELLSIG